MSTVPPSEMEATSHEEEETLMHKSEDTDFANDPKHPPRIGSQTSLSSFIQVKHDKLATTGEVMMNIFKAFLGSGILGLNLCFLSYFCVCL